MVQKLSIIIKMFVIIADMDSIIAFIKVNFIVIIVTKVRVKVKARAKFRYFMRKVFIISVIKQYSQISTNSC